MKNILAIIIIGLIGFNEALAQSKSVEDLDEQSLNWYNKDLKSDDQLGASVDKAYASLLKDKKSRKTVIVAVIDNGVQIEHEDLQGRIWTNTDEIAGNGIDDDENGYIDDVNGWNFLGGSDGKSIQHENYEYTRILRRNDKEHPLFEEAKALYEKEMQEKKTENEQLVQFEENLMLAKNFLKKRTGVEVKGKEDLEKIEAKDSQVAEIKNFLEDLYGRGFTEEGFAQWKEHNTLYIEYFLNKDFRPRELVGDDPLNFEDRDYGNANLEPLGKDHGTAVAGIIAGLRDNETGIQGIASDVKIMPVRAIPWGDERDKDVALAIMYAVDNGADIINMSFGKKMSPEKEFVDQAVKYAEEHNVLIVHSAGNDGEDIDENNYYPSVHYNDESKATNWLTVGASAMTLDEELPGVFSNYGKKNVDLFAPGVSIACLDENNSYNVHSGTSFAAPVVSGVAALILSYYPELTPQELIELLMENTYRVKKPRKVLKPSLEDEEREKIKFKNLSRSGGIVNAYEALKEAEKKYPYILEATAKK